MSDEENPNIKKLFTHKNTPSNHQMRQRFIEKKPVQART